jgi:hypothetical protein
MSFRRRAYGTGARLADLNGTLRAIDRMHLS